MKTIGLAEVLLFHQKIIDRVGGAKGIRDVGLIEGALNSAFSTFDGEELYPSVEDKIAVTTYALVKNHGFVDGNKRIGVAVMLLLLRMNSIHVGYTQRELVELGIGIASGQFKREHVRNWIENHRA